VSSIDWVTTRRALQLWIVTATGLAGDHVVWSGQRDAAGNSVPRPSGQYIELRLTLITPKGFDWKVYDYDGVSTLTERVRGPRHAVLTVRYFDGIPTTGGEWAPMEAMDNIATGIYLDTVYDAIIAANIGVGNIEPAQSTDGIMNTTKVEMRAMMAIQLNLSAELALDVTTRGWIDEVKADGIAATDLAPIHVDVRDT
jgi:hypothetical protein